MVFSHTEVFNFEGALRGMRNPLNSHHKSDSFFTVFSDDMDDDWKAETIHDLTEQYLKDIVDGDYDEAYHIQSDYLWDMSTRHSQWGEHASVNNFIGPNDLDLAKRLIHAGTEHRKFLRQIMVSVDITAPLYWWKEFDTYKVGTTANSTSTMHKLASTPITWGCFETDDLDNENLIYFHYDGADEPIDYTVGELGADIIEKLELLRLKYLETKDKRYWKELIRWLPNGWLQTRTVTMNYENLRSMYHQRKGHKLSEWSAFCEWCKQLPYAKELIID